MHRVVMIAAVLVFGCSSQPEVDDDTPTCAAPPVLDVPIAIARESGEPLHWRTGTCIEVTYAGLTAAQVVEVEGALAMWRDIGCASLCFTGLTESDAPLQGADGRIHIAASTGFPAASTTIYISSTGRIRAALIDLSGLKSATLVGQLGLNLGLDRPARGVDSVLTTATAPTARDAESLCALYGRPPLCD